MKRKNRNRNVSAKKFWYVERANELLLDADSEERRKLVLIRLGRAARLRVKRVLMLPSGKEGHWHIAVVLENNLSTLEAAAWRLRLGSDLFREAHTLIRLAHGIAAPSLLICRYPFEHREPDGVCDCTAHGEESMRSCKTARRIRPTEDSFIFLEKPRAVHR